MDKPQLEWQGNNRLHLSGALDVVTVPSVWQQSEASLSRLKAPILFVDLKQVSYSDSSGVALLLAWARLRKRKNSAIHFSHIPPFMLAIMKISGLIGILTITT